MGTYTFVCPGMKDMRHYQKVFHNGTLVIGDAEQSGNWYGEFYGVTVNHYPYDIEVSKPSMIVEKAEGNDYKITCSYNAGKGYDHGILQRFPGFDRNLPSLSCPIGTFP